MKRCRCCLETKPLGDFYRRTDSKDGYRARCKGCSGRRRQTPISDVVASAANPTGPAITAYVQALRADPCSYCGERFASRTRGTGLDHIVPRASGGGEGWENLTRACPACNIGKKSTSLLGFLMAVRLHPIWTALRDEAKVWRLV